MQKRARSKKQKQLQYQKIIDEGKNLFLEKGVNGFTLRDLAKRLKMAPSNIYNYFSSKRELWFAISRQEFDSFIAMAQQLFQDSEVTRELLESYAWFYVEYALQHPKEYDLMFNTSLPPSETIGPIEKTHEPKAFNQLHEIIKQAVKNGVLAEGNTEDLAFYFWAVLHGIVMVSRSVFKDEREDWPKIKDPDSFFSFAISRLMTSLE